MDDQLNLSRHTMVWKGAVFPHHFGDGTSGKMITKNMTIVDIISPESSPAAVI